MLGVEQFAGVVDAATVIGIVLLEAIVLYFAYGVLERRLGPRVVGAIRGD